MAVIGNKFVSPRRRLTLYRRKMQQTSVKSSYFVHIVILLCLMSLLTLGQIGVVATKGYAVSALQTEKTELLRLRDQLEVRYATAQSLEHIRKRAELIGLRPITPDQIEYMTIVHEQLATEPASNTSSSTASQQPGPNNPIPNKQPPTDP
jgi:hypothetical protein